MPPTPKTEKETKIEDKSKKDIIVAQHELSEEDKQLKDEIDMLIDRLNENNQSLYKPALELLRTMIRTSTTSMTSVPKPLKFLRSYYDPLKIIYEKIEDHSTKKFCADIISVLSMTFALGNQDCLDYRLKGSEEEIGSWGHEYVKHLSAEIRNVWNKFMDPISTDNTMKEKLKLIVNDIVVFSMKHNSETEACDLLMDIDCLDKLKDFVDNENYQRVALYLVSCVNYVPEPDNSNLLKTALEIYKIFDKPVEAIVLAIQLNDPALVKKLFESCSNSVLQKQMAFILARHNINYLENVGGNSEDEHMIDETNPSQWEEISEILSNSQLNTHFMSLARELDIMEPKLPEDIYKTHLDPIRPSFGSSGSGLIVDSARQNLASSFVNGFVNAAFGRDKLLTIDGGNKWIYKNKDHAMMSATASLGLIYLWDVDIGLAQIDKYLYTSEEYIKAGALMACGIVNAGVRNDCDPALALLSDYVLNESIVLRIASYVGLGLAYAGSKREDVLNLLLDGMRDHKSTMEAIGVAALSSGLVMIGAQSGELTSTILSILLERSDIELRANLQTCRFLALALALTNLGKQEHIEVVLAGLQAVCEPVRSMSKTIIEACAYAGTGNVLKIQDFLHICSEHYEPEPSVAKKEKESKKEKEMSATDKLAKNISNLLKTGTITSSSKDDSKKDKDTKSEESKSEKADKDKDKSKTDKKDEPETSHSSMLDPSSFTTRIPDFATPMGPPLGAQPISSFDVGAAETAGLMSAEGFEARELVQPGIMDEQDLLDLARNTLPHLDKLVKGDDQKKESGAIDDKEKSMAGSSQDVKIASKGTEQVSNLEEVGNEIASSSTTTTPYEDLSPQQGLAVLGIALIAMGEEIGSAMSYRTFGHLLRYGEPVIRRAVPLALALISVSNPTNLNIVDTLSKFSHDSDSEVAQNAILAMGIVGAGTNNARMAALLRQLAHFYSVRGDSSHASNPLFAVRIAQALIHAGKGTLTLNPFHCDRLLTRPVSLAGILIFLVSLMDSKNTILGKGHYLLYYLTVALRPRFLITFDASLNPLSIPVRVGQAVDVVGQAGKPKTITGFQTYTTPVLLGYGERAELATEEYVSLTPYLEGFVVLNKNPNYLE